MLTELEACLNVLEDVHAWAAEALEGLPPESLDWRPTRGEVGREVADPDATNSLAGLVMHIRGSERYLVGHLAGGRPFVDRDRPGEFRASGQDVEAFAARLSSTAAATASRDARVADALARALAAAAPGDRVLVFGSFHTAAAALAALHSAA